MTVVAIVLGGYLLVGLFTCALGRAAKKGDVQMARALAERQARENTKPFGSVERIY